MWEIGVSGRSTPTGQNAPVRDRQGTEEQVPPAAVPAEEKSRDTWSTQSREDAPKTLLELMEESRKRTEESRNRFKIKPRTNYGDITLEAYARLCRARTVSEVSAAAGYARRRAIQLKGTLRQDGENADRIRAAIAQLQKAVLRAGKKKTDLNREKLTAEQREHAATERRQREALRLQAELRRRQTVRTVREQGYLHEAAVSDRFAVQMALARAEYALPGGTEPTPPAVGVTVSAPATPEVSGFVAEA